MGLFDKLESKLEQGVNGAFARAFKSEVQPVEIASGIRRAMDDRASSVKKGQRPVVPNLFTIELSPTDYQRLAAWGDELDDELIASAQEHCDEQRYLPGGPLTIVLAEEHDLETGVFRLRPATAKAADAVSHSRNHPRPSAPAASPEPAGGPSSAPSLVQDDAAHTSYDSTTSAKPGVGTSSERGLGTRIKSYLLGESVETSGASTQHEEDPHRSHLDEHEFPQDEDLGTYDNDPRHHPDPRSENLTTDAPPEGTDDDAGVSATQAKAGATRLSAPSENDRSPEAPTHAAPMPAPRTPRPAPTPAPARELRDDVPATAAFTPTQKPPRPKTPSPRTRPWLKIDGQRYPLLSAITTLGRDDDADIVIDDPGVSRRHCEIRITHDGPHLVMSVRDLDSTNGTFVNGDNISTTHVQDGDRLTVGRTQMTIHRGDRT